MRIDAHKRDARNRRHVASRRARRRETRVDVVRDVVVARDGATRGVSATATSRAKAKAKAKGKGASSADRRARRARARGREDARETRGRRAMTGD